MTKKESPTGRYASAKADKRKSKYPSGAAFKPSDETLAKREAEVLDLLRRADRGGITYLTVPDHLSRSLANYIFGLRQKGFDIATLTPHATGLRVGVYVLRGEPPANG